MKMSILQWLQKEKQLKEVELNEKQHQKDDESLPLKKHQKDESLPKKLLLKEKQKDDEDKIVAQLTIVNLIGESFPF